MSSGVCPVCAKPLGESGAVCIDCGAGGAPQKSARKKASHADTAKEAIGTGVRLLVIGLIAAGVFLVSSGWTGGLVHDFQKPPAPTCDGKVMHTGDECVTVSGGQASGSGTSYGDQQLVEQIERLVGIAVVGLVAGTSGLVAILCLAIAAYSVPVAAYHFAAAGLGRAGRVLQERSREGI